MTLHFFNVDRLCARVDLEQERPLIDLSDVTFFEPFAIVYLGMFLRYFNLLGRYFSVKFPLAPKAREYLARQNFWGRFNFRPDIIDRENRLKRFGPSTSFGDIIDIERTPQVAEAVAEETLRIVWHLDCGKAIAEVVAELVDNFAQHAKGPLAVCAMQWYPNGRRVAVALGDCGIGIRSSLSSNPEYAYLASKPHVEGIVKAFQPLVSRRAEGGTGLTEVRDTVRDLGGRLSLSSGDGYFRMDGNSAAIGKMAFELSGVQVEISIPT